MPSIIRALFYPMPNVGDIFAEDDGNPFERRTFKILETRDGWVKVKCQCGECYKGVYEWSRFYLHFDQVKVRGQER